MMINAQYVHDVHALKKSSYVINQEAIQGNLCTPVNLLLMTVSSSVL